MSTRGPVAHELVKKAAQFAKFSEFLNALEEHKSEAERDDNPLMAELYGAVLNGLYASKGIKNGKVTVTLDLASKLR